jgi:hypothetical protein
VKNINVIVNDKALAFTLYDAGRNQIIVSIRATVPCYYENVIDDMNFVQSPFGGCSGCQAHSGFISYYDQIY